MPSSGKPLIRGETTALFTFLLCSQARRYFVVVFHFYNTVIVFFLRLSQFCMSFLLLYMCFIGVVFLYTFILKVIFTLLTVYLKYKNGNDIACLPFLGNRII
jgi:hypothetical protein